MAIPGTTAASNSQLRNNCQSNVLILVFLYISVRIISCRESIIIVIRLSLIFLDSKQCLKEPIKENQTKEKPLTMWKIFETIKNVRYIPLGENRT